jgi:hypothetical protein
VREAGFLRDQGRRRRRAWPDGPGWDTIGARGIPLLVPPGMNV